jgi:hypothetical protein
MRKAGGEVHFATGMAPVQSVPRVDINSELIRYLIHARQTEIARRKVGRLPRFKQKKLQSITKNEGSSG